MSWPKAAHAQKLSLGSFQRLFGLFNETILEETIIGVMLAFDESDALFTKNLDPLNSLPFILIDWSDYFFYKRGCVLVSDSADLHIVALRNFIVYVFHDLSITVGAPQSVSSAMSYHPSDKPKVAGSCHNRNAWAHYLKP